MGRAAALSVLLMAATFAVYLPVLHHPFANLDDIGYVYGNEQVQAGVTWPTIKWALLTFAQNNWHPLTWMSHALDCQLFDVDPAGHHAVNAIWHSLDAAVLFWVLLLATGCMGRSLMVAALFAFHPINVESVAWIAERKTVLSTFFFLLALGAYRWYVEHPGRLRYAAVAVLYILGLMAKPQIITLPFVLLLWDYWPLRRMFAANPTSMPAEGDVASAPQSFLWLVKEKIPLFIIAACSAVLTMKAQRAGPPQHWPYSIWIRAGNALVAYVRYLGKALWPSHLAVLYLHPANMLRFRQAVAAAVLLSLITALVLAGRRYRYLPVGWFWFLGTLVPTIGLIQVGWQAMADRYAYQSFIGLFILICWGVADWVQQRHLSKLLLPAVNMTVLLALIADTHRQIGYWSDDLTLWSHTLQVTRNNWVAEDMVGGILLKQGRREEAMRYYRNALAIYPGDWRSNYAIAMEEQRLGNLSDAIQHYQLALVSMEDPGQQSMAYENMAIAYRDSGDLAEAMECRRRAAQLRGQQ